MLFLEELPLVPSSRFSRKDIELFDTQITSLSGSPSLSLSTYREKYKKTVKEFKDISANTQTTLDTDLIKEKARKDKGNVWSVTPWEDCIDFTIGINLARETWTNDIIYDPKGGPQWVYDFVPMDNFHSWRKRLTFMYIDYDCDSNNYCSILDINEIITAFYIPENLEWLKLFCIKYTDIIKYDDLIMIGYYEKGYDPYGEGINSSLESILERSKDFSFLEEYGEIELKHVLENSKKRLLISNEYEGKNIEIEGIKHKRVTLVHPAFTRFPEYYIFFVEISEDSRIFIETINYNNRKVNERSNKVRFNPCYMPKKLTRDKLYFSDMGPKGYRLIHIDGKDVNILEKK